MSGAVILLVEDNPDSQTLTLRALRKNDIPAAVVIAEDGAEALDYLFGTGRHAGRDPAALPRLVLLDLQLPGVHGLEVLRRIRGNTRTRRLPVVILTSSTEPRDLAAGYDLGANSYVQKPVDFDDLLVTAGQLGRYWLRLNQAPPPDGH